jgi:hypothetical protein
MAVLERIIGELLIVVEVLYFREVWLTFLDSGTPKK